MVWSVAGLSRFSLQSMQNETATQTAESAMQSSNCIAMTATHFIKQKLVPDTALIDESCVTSRSQPFPMLRGSDIYPKFKKSVGNMLNLSYLYVKTLL